MGLLADHEKRELINAIRKDVYDFLEEARKHSNELVDYGRLRTIIHGAVIDWEKKQCTTK